MQPFETSSDSIPSQQTEIRGPREPPLKSESETGKKSFQQFLKIKFPPFSQYDDARQSGKKKKKTQTLGDRGEPIREKPTNTAQKIMMRVYLIDPEIFRVFFFYPYVYRHHVKSTGVDVSIDNLLHSLRNSGASLN